MIAVGRFSMGILLWLLYTDDLILVLESEASLNGCKVEILYRS